MHLQHYIWRRDGTTPLFLLLVFAAIFSTPSPAIAISPVELQSPFGVGPIKADPTRNLVYLVDTTNHRLLAIDTTAAQQVAAASIDVATVGELAVSIDDSTLYLSETTANKILVFSLPNLTPLPSLSVAFPPQSIATAENGRLFATQTLPNTQNAIVEISSSNRDYKVDTH